MARDEFGVSNNLRKIYRRLPRRQNWLGSRGFSPLRRLCIWSMAS
jgi:hypothetical protein